MERYIDNGFGIASENENDDKNNKITSEQLAKHLNSWHEKAQVDLPSVGNAVTSLDLSIGVSQLADATYKLDY